MSARLAVRSLARATPARRAASTSNAVADFTVLDASGVPTAAVDEGARTGAITIIAKAGSRYETAPGVAHILKNFAFRDTQKRSSLRIARETELYGGALTASLDREHLYLTAEFMRGDEAFFTELLAEAALHARYAEHDLREAVLPQVSSDREQALLSPRVAALEAAHMVAFRNGLGNSLLAPAHPHTTAGAVASFAESVMQSKSGFAVLGTGVSPEKLQQLVSSHFSTSSVVHTAAASNAGATRYHGGEIRLQSDSGAPAGVLIGFEGGSLHSPEYSVLRHLIGGDSSIKWSRGSGSVLAQALAQQPASAQASAFNLGYSDAGLFGAFVTGATSDEILKLGKSFISALDKAASSASDADLKRAITKAKFEAATTLESRIGRLEHIGAQIVSDGKITSLDAAFAALDKVNAKSVAEAAKRARKSRATVVAVGDSAALPYASDLGL